MKKAIVLLLALAVLGGAVFAEDLAYTLTGSASLIWGYDLNTEHHGFTNEAEATLDIDFVTEQSSTHGEEAITGSITISDFSVILNSDVDQDGVDSGDGFVGYAGDITAKILFPNSMYLQIATAPDFSVSNAAMQGPISADDWDGDDATYNPTAVLPTIASSGGFTFGMDGDFSFAFKVGSTNTHDDVAATLDSYMIGLDLGYAIEDMLTAGVNFIYGDFESADAMMGFGVNATATPIEGLEVYLGTDIQMFMDITGLDFQFDASYEMADLFSFGAGAYLSMPDLDSTVGNPMLTAVVNAGVLAVENLTFDVAVNMFDILDAADSTADIVMAFSVDASYKAMLGETNYVMPYANFAMIPETTGRLFWVAPEITTVNVGVEAMLIPLTTFTLDFTAGDITADSIFAGTTMGDTGDKGVITFTTTIEY